jgi:hypothetical protein
MDLVAPTVELSRGCKKVRAARIGQLMDPTNDRPFVRGEREKPRGICC